MDEETMSIVTINNLHYTTMGEPIPERVEVPDDLTRLVKVSGTPWGYFDLKLTPEESKRVFYAWAYAADIDLEVL
jgi:hypothetical protein